MADTERFMVMSRRGSKSRPGSGTLRPKPEPSFKPFKEFPTPKLLKEAQYSYAKEEHDLVERDGEVVPCPPSWTKICYRNNRDFTEVDKAAKQVPEFLLFRPLPELAEYLTGHLTADIDKIRSFFVWIAIHQTAAARGVSVDLERDSALYKLHLTLEDHTYYSILFMELCECVNIRCILVKGAAKDAGYNLGDMPESTNNWCLVFIDGFWGLVDQFGGSIGSTGGTKREWELDATDIDGYDGEQDENVTIFQMNEAYFLPPPYQFIYDSYPDVSEYQLLPRLISAEEFRRMASLNVAYFDHNIVDLSQPECCLSTDTGDIQLGFELGEDSYLKFNFALYKSSEMVTHQEDEVNLPNSVHILNEGDRRTVYIEFQRNGTYLLEVFVTDINNPFERRKLGSYLIKCTRPQFTYDPPIVDTNNPEFGPGADWKLLRIKAEEQSGILEAQDGKIHLSLLHENNDGMEYSFELVGDDSKERLRRTILYQRDPEGVKLYIRLSRHGKQLLKVHTKEDGSEDFSNTCNYMLKSDERCVEPHFVPDLQFQTRIGQVGKHHDLEPVSHPFAMFSVEDAQKSFNITMKKLMDVDVSVQLHLNTDEYAEDVSEHVLTHESDEDVSILLKIPQHGMYDLNILTRPRGSTVSPSMSWRYVIDAAMPSQDCLPFPSRHEAWSPHFVLHSPLHGILEEDTEVDFDLETPDAAHVYTIQEDTGGKIGLKKKSPGHFSGKVRAVSCSPLHVMAVFGGKKGKESKGEQLLEYKVVSSQDYAAVQDKAQKAVDNALERREELLKAKTQEKEAAKQRKKDAMIKARERENLFDLHHPELKKQRDAQKLYVELQKAIEARNMEKIVHLVQLYSHVETYIEDHQGILNKARTMLQYRRNLLRAIRNRDPGEIFAALDEIIHAGYESELQEDILKAKREMLGLKNATFKRLDMPSKLLSQIPFRNPPKAIFRLIRALMLMLGENEERSQYWQNCRPFLIYRDIPGETGRLKIRDVDSEIAARVIQLVENAGYVENQSYTALYDCLHSMLMDCIWKLKSRGREIEDATPADVRRQKEILKPATPANVWRQKAKQKPAIPASARMQKAKQKPATPAIARRQKAKQKPTTPASARW